MMLRLIPNTEVWMSQWFPDMFPSAYHGVIGDYIIFRARHGIRARHAGFLV